MAIRGVLRNGNTGGMQYTPTTPVPAAVPIAVSVWYKKEEYSNNGGEEDVFYIGGGTNNLILIYNRVLGGFGLITSTLTYYRDIVPNRWNHICLVVASATSRKLYINGRLVVTQTASYALGTINQVTFGAIGDGPFSGTSLSSVTIFSRALSDADVFCLSQKEIWATKPTVYHPFSSPIITPRGSFEGLNGSGTVSNFPAGGQATVRGGEITFPNEFPTIQSTLSILGSFSSRRRLFVVS